MSGGHTSAAGPAAPAPRVLHVLATLRPSGAERMLEAAARVRVFADAVLSTGEDGAGPFAASLAAAGYRLHHLRFRRHPAFLVALWRLLRAERFDVVHVHCERAAFWIAAVARLAGTPRLVRTVHSVFAFEGGLRWRRTVQRRLVRLLGGATLVHSPSVLASERRRFANPARLVPPWIDDARFRPPTPVERAAARAAFGVTATAFVVAVVGNCAAVKNHDAALEAMALLTADGVDAVLLHAGTAAAEADERSLAARLGLVRRVRFLGGEADVRAVLHAADAFVMPSLYEGLGLAAVEALACGLPCVLADVEGLRDLSEFGAAIAWCGTDAASIASAATAVATLAPETRHAAAALARRRFSAAAGWAATRSAYGTGAGTPP